LNQVPHEIVVVDDGSRDRTGSVAAVAGQNSRAAPASEPGEHGFGRAVVFGLRHIQGTRRSS